MSIPESQLETWSHQGSINQSSKTYNSIKSVLEAKNTPYVTRNYKVFLQGSYGNDTNIYSESDVDIVIKLNDCFQHDLSNLPIDQQDAFKASYPDATYNLVNFKSDVQKVLSAQYGRDVDVGGGKAIKIAANGTRRKTDVIAAIQFRRYHKFFGTSNQSYDEGICFYTGSGTKIVNYPEQHSANLTGKHQRTSGWFKPMIRILKNLRSKLVTDRLLNEGSAPSYYLEGLLYNVPDNMFGVSYEKTFVNAITWICNEDRSKFICANEQYYLLHASSPVTWRSRQCDAFLKATVDLWSQW